MRPASSAPVRPVAPKASLAPKPAANVMVASDYDRKKPDGGSAKVKNHRRRNGSRSLYKEECRSKTKAERKAELEEVEKQDLKPKNGTGPDGECGPEQELVHGYIRYKADGEKYFVRPWCRDRCVKKDEKVAIAATVPPGFAPRTGTIPLLPAPAVAGSTFVGTAVSTLLGKLGFTPLIPVTKPAAAIPSSKSGVPGSAMPGSAMPGSAKPVVGSAKPGTVTPAGMFAGLELPDIEEEDEGVEIESSGLYYVHQRQPRRHHKSRRSKRSKKSKRKKSKRSRR